MTFFFNLFRLTSSPDGFEAVGSDRTSILDLFELVG